MPLPPVKPLDKADSDSLLFKAAEFLNRTNSASMGLVTEMLQGGDPFAAAGRGIMGEQTYGGQDVMAALFGGSPDDKFNRRAGLVADVLNPLDPLNYVAVGGLTKAGKLAKLGKGIEGATQLAHGAAAQTKAGQRGLVSFMGQRVPLPGDAALLGALEKGGRALKESKPGRGIQKLFGGKEGFIASGMADTLKREGVSGQHDLEQFLGAKSRASRAEETYRNSTQKFVDEVRLNVKKKEWADFTGFLDQAGKGPDALMQDAARFIGSGPGADRRRKAVEAAQSFFAEHGRLAPQLLGEEGIGGMASSAVGYVPRKYRYSGDIDTIPSGFDPLKTGEATRPKLEGAADNALNRMLIQASEEPISRTTLTKAGQQEFDRLGPAALEKMRVENPKAYAEWTQKNRLPISELSKMLEGQGVTLEQRPWILLRHIQEQTANKIRTDKLIEELQNAKTFDGAPLVRKWDEISKEEASKYIKIDQGRWRNSPLAVPRIYDEALNRFQEVMMPGPDKPLMGELMNTVLPKAFQNAGLMSWWKGLAIYGSGPTAYWNRNFASGVLKNYLEGIGPSDAMRYYPEAVNIVGESLKSRLDPSAMWAKGTYTTRTGEKISYKRIMQEYWNRNFHGGGSREGVLSEIVGEADNLSGAARERMFGTLHRGNFRVEMMLRLPLMLKTIDDTFEVANKAGARVPKAIGELDISPAQVRDVFDVALTNAREAVIRSHFDYDDLTPFEKKLRARWIPFWTWMSRNIPHETVNMIQQPGKYMPFARAYYNAFEQQQIAPEDLPQWAARSFAMPIAPSEGDRARWLDWTGFLPFMDVAELGQTAAIGLGLAEPELGQTRPAEVIRYIATRGNPFIAKVAEQGLQKSFFTKREFSGDMPTDVLGQTVGASTRNLAELVPPVMAVDRLNPFGLFGPSPRPHRNEPAEAQRWLRTLTGVKTYATDKDEASMSTRARQRKIAELRRAETRELRAGNEKGAEFIRNRRLDLEKGR